MALLYAVTVFLGAFLLFQVQPLVSKWILPWYGGGPAIWTTCLVFFQSTLFAGYAYAHVSEKYFPKPARLAVHLALVLAASMLSLAPEAPGTLDHPTVSILRLLGVTVGIPFFLLSTTGPLVQTWFSRVVPDRSPYRLYALSNIGSLAALLTYPFLVEPRWGLRAQSTFWTWSFRAFAAIYAVGAVAAWRKGAAPAAAEEEGTAPAAWRKLLWIVLPAFAAAMLVASTNQLCQDVAVIPFLWVLPLAAYLVSFILTFDHPRWYRPAWIAPATIALTFAAAVTDRVGAITPTVTVVRVAVLLSSLFGICLLCHGELARLRPDPRFLTSYYLAISGGGAIGGALVSLAAPQVFATFFEWKLGIAVAYVGSWGCVAGIHRARLREQLNLGAVLAVVAVVGFAFLVAFFGAGEKLEVARNFYGAVSVVSRGDGTDDAMRDFVHGRILHGREYVAGPHHGRPTTYYLEASGVGRSIAFFRSRPDLRVGVVGLGVGTLAAYAESGSQSFRFYEINPEVIRIARARFTYLKECEGKAEVVLGDARLSLEREAPRRYHVLALDAFSGDTIPTHLLTAEAMALYLRHLEPDGILVVHISNHYLDLAPVVRGMAHRAGMKTAGVEHGLDESGAGQSSRWMVCTRNEAALREAGKGAPDDAGEREVFWTDDANDLFSILRLR